MSTEAIESQAEELPPPAEDAAPENSAKLVPVVESIKYRRRAQQAEHRVGQLQQELEGLKTQLEERIDQVATAEAQRDEAQQRLAAEHNRLLVERLMAQSGVVDPETAWMLLGKKLDLSAEVDDEALCQGVQRLLEDKPFLVAPQGALAPKSAAARDRAGLGRDLALAAQRAAHSGDRKDVAHYLRLRRRASLAADR